MAVVKEPIEDGGCHHRIAEYGSPLTDATVAGEQDRALLVAAVHELERTDAPHLVRTADSPAHR